MTRYYAESPCVHGETREHRTGPFKAGGKTSWGTCAGVTRRELTIDYAAAARITRELTSLLPVQFEGSHDAVVWTLNIVQAALGDPE